MLPVRNPGKPGAMDTGEDTRISAHPVDGGDTGRMAREALWDTAWIGDQRQPALLVMSGPMAGRVFSVGFTPLSVGRQSDCEICLPDNEVSRRHARLERDDNGNVVISDLESTNGTYVDGLAVQRHALREGERIRIGASNVFEFSYQDDLKKTFHQRQYERSVYDGLTGLLNRRHFLSEFRRELAYALRNKTPTSLALLDIDRFKSINDTFGHSAGDHVLRELSQCVKKNLREEDFFARYGGEEFAIVLRGQSETDAYHSAERIRALVEAARITWEGQHVPLTISIGVASRDGREIRDAGTMLRLADQNLYAAKAAGRNRAVSENFP